jgi:hypothetical protein
MGLEPHNLEEVHLLAAAFVDDELTPEQHGRLAQLLEDPAARIAYLAYVRTQAMMLWRFNTLAPALPAHFKAPRQPRPTHKRLLPLHLIATAAGIILAAGAVIALMLSQITPPSSRPSVRPVELFASIVDSRGAEFDQSDVATTPGSQVSGGFIRLLAGEVDIEFFSGAAVTITGPASFGINSAMRGFLEHGQIAVHCPEQAKGFTIGAPGVAIVDLGTRFTMSKEQGGGTTVTVQEGRVRLEKTDDQGRSLSHLELTTHQMATVNEHHDISVVDVPQPVALFFATPGLHTYSAGPVPSDSDLVNAGAPTLAAANPIGFVPHLPESDFHHVNDGLSSASPPGNGAFEWEGNDGVWTAEFVLDTTIHTRGYDITDVISFVSWGDRTPQAITVSYDTVSNPRFIDIGVGTVENLTDHHGTTTIQITDANRPGSLPIATGVKTIRVRYTIPNSAKLMLPVVAEIDVLGRPTGSGAAQPRTPSHTSSTKPATP